jgi:hypothetical protein
VLAADACSPYSGEFTMSQAGYGYNDSHSRPFRVEVPLTGFTITLDQNPTLVITPAGTLATGTVLLPLNPEDGQRFEMISTQTQTALTITANTGDTINNVPTALVALTGVRLGYKLSSRIWYRLP